MGRRSVNTTKSGKFMNPTDQARKEARKRELKKNKKQRMAVRHAVLKAKDPLQLLEETALYDKQEYDPNVEAHLNERVLQEKRRKLLETFDRLVLLYRKEDAEYANRLQAARNDYDKKRHEMMLFYEQVKLAERVKTSDIPLPKLPQSQMGLIASDIPLPTGSYAKSILKKSLGAYKPSSSVLRLKQLSSLAPVPNLLHAFRIASRISSAVYIHSGARRPKWLEREFTDRKAAAGDNLSNQANASLMEAPSKFPSGFSSLIPPLSQIPLPPPTALPSFTGLLRPGFPGAPQPNQVRFMFQSAGNAVLSAPPSLHPRDPLDNADILGAPAVHPASSLPPTSKAGSATGTTIEAKPQLKNLIGDATRFVPTAIKIRRTTRDPTGRLVTVGGGVGTHGPGATGKTSVSAYDRISRADGTGSASAAASASKDDAYEEFMREMEGLL
ncbi:WW domain-binding protein 11 [Clonorchis sinensis]|uniref:WW domain-binding protein 11 n=1 Tax=Clonorchis sinensis TaxID=79923 RepID=A0A8T1M6U8_CLOSI|nr:WW domain-binding protein 11 [Clonorchis sinensis]